MVASIAIRLISIPGIILTINHGTKQRKAALLKFTPLVLGGTALCPGAIVAFKVSVIYQYLVGAIAIVIGYMIPGYLLKRQESWLVDVNG